jgi:hypothetical protein
MDKTTLVESDIRLGNQIIAHLGAAGVDIEDALWVYSPQIEEWRLFIASGLVDKSGPIAAYDALLRALRQGGMLDKVPYRRISLLSPADPMFAKLRFAFGLRKKQASGLPKKQGFEGVGLRTPEEAYVYEGSIHILRVDRPNRVASYLVMFAPYRGPGGAMPTRELAGEQELQQFLVKEVAVLETIGQNVIGELKLRGSATIDRIRAKEKELKRWGLLP